MISKRTRQRLWFFESVALVSGSLEVMSRSIAAPPPTSCTHPAEDAKFHDLACKKGKKHGKKTPSPPPGGSILIREEQQSGLSPPELPQIITTPKPWQVAPQTIENPVAGHDGSWQRGDWREGSGRTLIRRQLDDHLRQRTGNT